MLPHTRLVHRISVQQITQNRTAGKTWGWEHRESGTQKQRSACGATAHHVLDAAPRPAARGLAACGPRAGHTAARVKGNSEKNAVGNGLGGKQGKTVRSRATPPSLKRGRPSTATSPSGKGVVRYRARRIIRGEAHRQKGWASEKGVGGRFSWGAFAVRSGGRRAVAG